MASTPTIGIDASRLTVSEKTGIEVYAKELIHALIALDHSTRFRLYTNEQPNYKFPNNVEVVVIPKKRFWTQTALAKELRRNPPDIFFSPVYTLPHNHPSASIITIHGLEFLTTPESYSRWHKWYHHIITKYGIRHAAHIIAVSHNTKKDLIKMYHADPEKIAVVHNGIHHTNIQRNPSATPTIISIGRLEKRKNTAAIVRAFSEYKRQFPNNAQLILAGKWGTVGVQEIKEVIEQSGCKNDIHLPGFVSPNEKIQLLREAHVFVFPSRYEGFGLPVLEAMDMGVPVIASRSGSISEIADDAALYCDPEQTQKFAEALNDILSHPETQRQMSKKGKIRVEQFSWERCAKETLRVLLASKQRANEQRSSTSSIDKQ